SVHGQITDIVRHLLNPGFPLEATVEQLRALVGPMPELSAAVPVAQESRRLRRARRYRRLWRLSRGLLGTLLGVCVAATAFGGSKHAWRVDIDPNAVGSELSRALLGHYDLSGALFAYDQVPG